MGRYRYVATNREYCDFCLELLALCGIACNRELKQINQENKEVGWMNEVRRSFTTRILAYWCSDHSINYPTFEDFLVIMENARIEYEKSNGDLDRYLSSKVVEEFKIRFIGSGLDDRELLRRWVCTFQSLVVRTDVFGESRFVPATQNYETPVTSGNFIPDIRFWTKSSSYYLDPIFVIDHILVRGKGFDCDFEPGPIPYDTCCFTPTKFKFFTQTISQIINDDSRSVGDRYKSLFALIEFVFDSQYFEHEMMWLLYVILQYCPPYQDLNIFHRFIPGTDEYGDFFSAYKYVAKYQIGSAFNEVEFTDDPSLAWDQYVLYSNRWAKY
jgi:hypothetical protein